jgi:hypothetical protein
MIKSKSFKTVTSKIQIYKLTQAFDFWIIKTFLTKSTAFHIKSHDFAGTEPVTELVRGWNQDLKKSERTIFMKRIGKAF